MIEKPCKPTEIQKNLVGSSKRTLKRKNAPVHEMFQGSMKIRRNHIDCEFSYAFFAIFHIFRCYFFIVRPHFGSFFYAFFFALLFNIYLFTE